MITASTGASFKLGASRAELPWQNITNSPTPAPTLSTAIMVFAPARNFEGSLSSTNCGRTSSSLRPLMEGSFLVATTEPSTRARNMGRGAWCVVRVGERRRSLQLTRSGLLLFRGRRFFGQHRFHFRVGAGDDV